MIWLQESAAHAISRVLEELGFALARMAQTFGERPQVGVPE